jgi:hypothetical protein
LPKAAFGRRTFALTQLKSVSADVNGAMPLDLLRYPALRQYNDQLTSAPART